jgi:hypothetical protein
VDAPAAATEDASLATSRWCRSSDCRRRDTPERPCYCHHCCCQSRYSCFPLPLALTLAFAVVVGVGGQEGEGPPEDTVVPAVVGAKVVAEEEDALHLRARSRTRRPVPRPPSGPARSP